MKCLVLSFVITGCLSSLVFGQVGFMDSTNTWTEVQLYTLGHESFKMTMSADPTVYNGKTYFEMLYSLNEEGGLWQNTWSFLRYDDQKLFMGYPSVELLIFDYSLEVNDTLYPDDGPVYLVTGIDSVVLANGEKRKRLHTQCPFGFWGDQTIFWIEGMPGSAGLYDLHSICAADAGSALLCIYKNDEFLYSNADSCWLLPVPTFEIEKTNIEIRDNPVENWLNITDPDQQVDLVSVFDFIGRRLYRSQELSINMQNALPGYYVVSIRLNSGQFMAYKILKW